mmetsp:Transcript_28703/g.37636  ORF Transcript_28703/g.37636 Transcript_28703/m.37636 type:complete len:655 (-) Transcript_28703:288-2252(-)|eukprot:CAMPEP_0117829090 /NCGR_PEP_ID=MMETSP0949-20121206/7656_1 /TAXON_ID=44440 /ORGANISM="Chattonella subsalsa, Strain CCMP2191" /LENGTH=654 /DNA_ID=CAMNT_0005669769 /DNA_START=44 /DNA_END=2008 /DNA_ORIENTATION=+
MNGSSDSFTPVDDSMSSAPNFSICLDFPIPSFCSIYSSGDVQSDVIFESSLKPASWKKDAQERINPDDIQIIEQSKEELMIVLVCRQRSNADCHRLKDEGGFSMGLSTFKQKAVVKVAAWVLTKCPLFAKYLFSEQKGNGKITINFSSARMMDAFMLVLNSVGKGPSITSFPDLLENAKRVSTSLLPDLADLDSFHMIDPAPPEPEILLNLYEVAAAAALLGHGEIQLHCELFLLRDIDLESFVRAAQYAHVCRRELMLKALYFSMKRLGLRSTDNLDHILRKGGPESVTHENMRIESQKPADQIKHKFKQLKTDIKTHQKRTKHELKHQLGVSPRITVDPNSGDMVNKQGIRCPLKIFQEQIQEEHRIKRRFFDARCYPAAQSDDYKNGYPGMTQYCLQRKRSEDGMTQIFQLYPRETQNSDKKHLEMELAAITTAEKTTFEFSMTDNDFTSYGDKYIGKMTSSFTGRFFHLYDYGLSTNRMYPQELLPELVRKEHCLVVYSVNILGREPNQFEVLVPDVSLDETVKEEVAFQEGSDFEEIPISSDAVEDAKKPSKLAKIYSKNNLKGYKLLKTQQAQWDQRIQAWTLDFKSRVKVPSKKNFIVIDPNDPSQPYMVFGKVTKNRFSLDCRAPLTPLSALFIALTSFATKLLVT